MDGGSFNPQHDPPTHRVADLQVSTISMSTTGVSPALIFPAIAIDQATAPLSIGAHGVAVAAASSFLRNALCTTFMVIALLSCDLPVSHPLLQLDYELDAGANSRVHETTSEQVAGC
ncbi:hypothetical protein LIA77_03726 [Sarocladium implicatum]|nr:hypothetical protein LIA77_03726 [Sarocladium implicatum]